MPSVTRLLCALQYDNYLKLQLTTEKVTYPGLLLSSVHCNDDDFIHSYNLDPEPERPCASHPVQFEGTWPAYIVLLCYMYLITLVTHHLADYKLHQSQNILLELFKKNNLEEYLKYV